MLYVVGIAKNNWTKKQPWWTLWWSCKEEKKTREGYKKSCFEPFLELCEVTLYTKRENTTQPKHQRSGCPTRMSSQRRMVIVREESNIKLYTSAVHMRNKCSLINILSDSTLNRLLIIFSKLSHLSLSTRSIFCCPFPSYWPACSSSWCPSGKPLWSVL